MPDNVAEFKELRGIEETTYNLSDVEIFKAGTWNGDEYTTDDIDDMVSAFLEIGHEIKPYLKLGHDNNQKLLQKDGLPAAGWIVSLKRVGDSLVADFRNIPEKIYALISNKAYGRFSSEIFWNVKWGQKIYRRALKAVALLGSDVPAVHTLDDFITLYTDNVECEEIKHCSEYTEVNMELDKRVQELEELVKKYQLENAELRQDSKVKDLEKEKSALASEIAELKAYKESAERASRKAEVEVFIEKNKNKISPAMKEAFLSIVLGEEAEVKKYSGKSQFEVMQDWVACLPEIKELGEVSAAVEVERKSENSDDNLDEKAKKYALENKVSYKEALIEVSREVK